MDPKDLRTLKILEEIEKDNAPSQRYLAQRLNVSLGLVNSFIKRCAQKGFFKVSTIPKNRVRYILTPQGAAEKTRLTYQYLQFSFRFYKEARQKLRQLFGELARQNVRQIVFFGAGDLAEIAYVSLHETEIRLAAVVDRGRIGERFLNRTVRDPRDLTQVVFDRLLVIDIENAREAISVLTDLGMEEAKIVTLPGPE